MKRFNVAAAEEVIAAAEAAVPAAEIQSMTKEVDWKKTVQSRSFDIEHLPVTKEEYKARVAKIRDAKEALVAALEELGIEHDEDWDVFTWNGRHYAGKPQENEDLEEIPKPRLLKGGKPVEHSPEELISPDDIFGSLMAAAGSKGEKCPYELAGSMAQLSHDLREYVADQNGYHLVEMYSESTGAHYEDAVKRLPNGFNKHLSFFFVEDGQDFTDTVESLEFGLDGLAALKALAEYSASFWMSPERFAGEVLAGRLVVACPKGMALSEAEAAERMRFMHTSAELRAIMAATRGESLFDRETLAVDREYRLLCALQGTDASRNKDAEEKAKDLAARSEREIQLSNLAGYVLYMVAAESGRPIGEKVDYSSSNIQVFYEGLQEAGSAGAMGYLRDVIWELCGESGTKTYNPYKKATGVEYFNADGELKQMKLGGNVGIALTGMLVEHKITQDDFLEIIPGWLAKTTDIQNRIAWLRDIYLEGQQAKERCCLGSQAG